MINCFFIIRAAFIDIEAINFYFFYLLSSDRICWCVQNHVNGIFDTVFKIKLHVWQSLFTRIRIFIQSFKKEKKKNSYSIMKNVPLFKLFIKFFTAAGEISIMENIGFLIGKLRIKKKKVTFFNHVFLFALIDVTGGNHDFQTFNIYFIYLFGSYQRNSNKYDSNNRNLFIVIIIII